MVRYCSPQAVCAINEKKRPLVGALSWKTRSLDGIAREFRRQDPCLPAGHFIVILTPEAEPRLRARPLEVVPSFMITPFSFFRYTVPAPAAAAPPAL